MQNVTVPYGEGSLTFPVEDGLEITRLELNDYPPLADFNAELERVLNKPTGSAPLREKVKAGDKVAIIISDFTRASYRTDAYLARLLDECNAGGVPDSDITVVIATGYHEDATEEEKRILAGEEAVRRVKIVSHNCRADDLVHLGRTQRGNEVYINRIVAEEQNHQNCFSRDVKYEVEPKCNSGILEGNPVSEEMFEIAGMVDPAFLVNVIVSDHGEFCGVVAGDWREAYYEGVEIIKKIYGVHIHKKFDAAIISNGGAPKDCNLFQSVKGLHNGLFAMNDGSSVVLCAECFNGFGPEGYRLGFECGSYEELWEKQAYERYDPEMAISLLTMRYLTHMKVYLISGLSDEEVRKAGMIPVKTPEEAWALIKADKPELKELMVLPCGALTCPIVEEE